MRLRISRTRFSVEEIAGMRIKIAHPFSNTEIPNLCKTKNRPRTINMIAPVIEFPLRSGLFFAISSSNFRVILEKLYYVCASTYQPGFSDIQLVRENK